MISKKHNVTWFQFCLFHFVHLCTLFSKGGNAWLMNFCPTLNQYLFKIYTNICFTQRQEIWSSQLQWSWFCRQNVKLQTLSCYSQGGLSFHKCKIDFGSRNPMNDNIATERREELWKYSFGNPNIKILEIQTLKKENIATEWKVEIVRIFPSWHKNLVIWLI